MSAWVGGQGEVSRGILPGVRRVARRVALLAGLGFVLATQAGCLNPEFVNAREGGLFPTAPGDTPFVLVRIVNDTTARLDGDLFVDVGASQPVRYFFFDINPEIKEIGFLLEWPIIRLSLGPLEETQSPSLSATFDNGLTVAVPFGQQPLVGGRDFFEGDTIIFRFTPDSRSESFIGIDSGRIAGTTQQGPFERADTFEVARLLLLQNALLEANELGL